MNAKTQTLGDALIDAVRQMDTGTSRAEVCAALDSIVERTPPELVKKCLRSFLAGMIEGFKKPRADAP